jgi:hypothetical protein
VRLNPVLYLFIQRMKRRWSYRTPLEQLGLILLGYAVGACLVCCYVVVRRELLR